MRLSIYNKTKQRRADDKFLILNFSVDPSIKSFASMVIEISIENLIFILENVSYEFRFLTRTECCEEWALLK